VRRAIVTVVTATVISGAITGWISVLPAAASTPYQSVVKQASPFAYWQLAEAPGTLTAVDSSGNGNSGTYAPCVVLGQGGPLRQRNVTAALLGAQLGCYMTFQPSVGYSGSYSVEAWIKPSSASKYYQTFVDSRSTNGEFSVDFKLTGTSNPGGQQLCADIGDGYEWLANPCTAFAFRANQWYYIALTVSETDSNLGVATFYVDGQPVNQVGVANYGALPLLTDSNHPIVLGGNPRYDDCGCQPPENFDGTVGQVAVYEYPLSANQVSFHYLAGVQP
jgi:hypothetical protein